MKAKLVSMLLFLPALGIALLLDAAALTGASGEERSPVIDFSNMDMEMAAAQAKARSTLPQFWRVFENPGLGEEGFSLKVAVPVRDNSSEHIWLVDIERSSARITGVVNNVPRDAKTLHAGERIDITEDHISDWMFLRAGKIVGNETMRPALKRMPKEEAARFREMMAEP
jgi:uncharacterized protein YegJ (DUF2314 family)